MVPAIGQSAPIEVHRPIPQIIIAAPVEIPGLQHQSRKLERMARCRARGAKHRITLVSRIDGPVFGEMLGQAPVLRRPHLADEEIEDPDRAVQKHPLARSLEGGE